MSSFLTTALLGSAVIAGSGIALAQDSTTKVKPCLGELCPPKSPRVDMPKQTIKGANQGKQMQAQDQSSGQVMPRKKKQASFHRNRHKQQPSKKTASRFNFWDWLTHR